MNCHFKPLFIFKIFLFVAHDTKNSNDFVFVDSNTFEIFYRIKSRENNYIIKHVDQDRFILSGENELYEVYIKSKTEIFTEKLLDYSIDKILWSNINYENFIYHFDEKINIYNFKLKQLIDIKEIKVENVLDTYSTNNGSVLVLKIKSGMIGYNTRTGEQVFFKTVNDLRSLMIIDNYLQVEIADKNKIVRYLVDLTKKLNEIEWIKYDEKEVTHDIFIDKSLNANLKYIWITEKQVDRQMDKTKCHIILI